MTPETVYFLSDTHLGDGSAADRFRYPQQLHDLLVRIESEAAQLVLLGDILELWAATMEAVMVRHAPLLKQISRIAATRPVTYVVGNHDCLPWYYYLGERLGNLTITERFQTPRGNLLALHGHQFDPFNRVTVAEDGQVRVPATEKLVRIAGLAERLGKEAVVRTVDRLGQSVESAVQAIDQILRRQSPEERGYPAGESIYDDVARSLLRGNVQFVLMGHTHHPLVHTYGTRTYINTGSWVSERYPPTYARYRAGRLELLEAHTHQPYVPA